MYTNGRLTSGICSTLSRMYEKTPSTVIATITIVAKTGVAIDVRVIHMVAALAGAAGLRARRVLRRRGRADQRRRAVLQVVEARRQHRRLRRQRRLDLDAAIGLGAAAGDDDAPRELAAVDQPDVRLAGFAAHGRQRQRRRRCASGGRG